MFQWLKVPDSLARGLAVWVVMAIAMLTVVFSNPSLVAEDQETPPWLGAMPFAAALLGYLCYRRPNPLAALLDVGRSLARPESGLRGWFVGLTAVAIAGGGLEAILQRGALDDQPWLVWVALAVGGIVGHAAASDANLLRAVAVGLRRVMWTGLGLLGIGATVAIVLGGLLGVRAFFAGYGILGAIAVLLAIIVFQLDRLTSSRDRG